MIAKLNTELNQWSIAGRLNTARFGHGVIVTEDQFLVVGGASERRTERCYLIDSNDEMTCHSQEPTLQEYRHWPELLLIDEHLCSSY